MGLDDVADTCHPLALSEHTNCGRFLGPGVIGYIY
jgi:hypothetical protein